MRLPFDHIVEMNLEDLENNINKIDKKHIIIDLINEQINKMTNGYEHI